MPHTFIPHFTFILQKNSALNFPQITHSQLSAFHVPQNAPSRWWGWCVLFINIWDSLTLMQQMNLQFQLRQRRFSWVSACGNRHLLKYEYYLYLCLQPLTLGQKGLLADHLLSSNKILRVQRKAVLLPMLVQYFLENIHWRSWYHITWKIVPKTDDSEREKIGPQLSVTA